MCSTCTQGQSLQAWLDQMDAEGVPMAKDPGKGTSVHDLVLNDHGQLIDPAVDVLDNSARKMLAMRQTI